MSENQPYFAAEPPMVINPAIYSYSFIIRDGILERLKAAPTFSSIKKFAKNRGKGPVQNENLPFLACYFMDEMLGPDGDINAGAPHFMHRLKLGFSVIVQSNDNEVAEKNLDIAHWAIMNYLTRQDWWHFKMPDPWPDVQIEGVERGSRKFVFGNTALNNETPIAELQMDLTLVHRTYFPPEVLDQFLSMHVTVAGEWPYDPNAGDSFPIVYDIPQDIDPVP
jgi:hypothetical protein